MAGAIERGKGDVCLWLTDLDITELVSTIIQCLDPGLETPVRKDLTQVVAFYPVEGLFCDIILVSDNILTKTDIMRSLTSLYKYIVVLVREET